MDNNTSPLRRALQARDLGELYRLLDSGADINERDGMGESLLDEAITTLEGRLDLREIVSELLRRGADPKIRCNEGSGPLFAAVIIKDAVIMRLLLEAGADPNAERDGSETVYEWAEFDYRYDEFDLDLPEAPQPEDKRTEDAWLLFLERLANVYHKRPPDYLRVLREFGARRSRETVPEPSLSERKNA